MTAEESLCTINLPDVLAEVTAECDRYEIALTNNQVDVLDAAFWDHPRTIRYGASENLYGYAAIREFRAQRPSKDLQRTVVRREITTYGRNLATSNLEFTRAGKQRIGRQSQTWARLPQGWRIIAAHVSWMESCI